MALPSITFQKGQGGLGRPLTSQDHISGLLFYTSSLPSGFSSGARVKALYGVADAISAGIMNDYSDGTAATATIKIDTLGSTGDTIAINVVDVDDAGTSQTTTLCTYTQTAADTTKILLAGSIADAINAQVLVGYTATNGGTDTVTITAPKKFGIFLNSGTPLTNSITGTIATTITQFSGGAYSKQAVWYYHISEFFRMQPKGILYVGFYAVPSPYTFSEITLMQQYAEGAIRQIGVFVDSTAFATSHITAIDTICKANDAIYQPLSALYVGNLAAVSDISTLTDLNTLSANKVTAVIGQDGGGQGRFLWITSGKTVSILGAELGSVAFVTVSQSIAWVGKVNVSNGTECEVIGFGNGVLFSATSVTNTLLTSLNDKRYTFLRKFVGVSGSYFNDSHTAVISTSDYAYIENNRVIDKATRLLYSAYLPDLNSPLQLNTDGTLSDNTVIYLENKGNTALDQMVRDSELSGKSVSINPTQDVLATSTIIIAVELLINGVARQIEIPIGFTSSIS